MLGVLLRLAVKVAIIASVSFLVISLCSCSSTRTVSAESAVSDSLTVAETSRDSVGSRSQIDVSQSGYLDIVDLTLTFYPPGYAVDPVSGQPSIAKPPRLHPATVNIGRLTAGKQSEASLRESADSVGADTADLAHVSSAETSGTHIRDPAPRVWPVCLVFGFAVAMIAFIIYRIRHDLKA